ncbi:AAA domain-containing protein [Paraburkholderia sp. J10-1]|uniref:AAA domain-containing protein n=1 Tax=Paraburkholderia sp. J10-1 TaxID=2805430 RepID=UPI002AB791A6|nr:AAA domain-containing protein [Paraburkholderia sp. J10-1]
MSGDTSNGTSYRSTITLSGTGPRFLANGRYVVKGAPRRGGLASVFKAYDTHSESHVAVKIFRAEPADEVVEESFRRETQALRDLLHPNIVSIFDSGVDDETGEHFIAMEWVESELSSLLDKKRYDEWGSYFAAVGRPVLEALAFAHTRATAHRDIKPSNILIHPDGTVRVCDFGISKIRDFLEPGITLAQYASMPFAPPELDDGSFTYSRDVFGFAALSIYSLCTTSCSTHAELVAATDTINVPEPVRVLLKRCLALENPAERPSDAASLLIEFGRLEPRREPEKFGAVLVSLTKKVSSVIEFDLGLRSDAECARFIEADLANANCGRQTGIAGSEGRPAIPSRGAIRLIGEKYRYIAAISDNGQRLVLTAAIGMTAFQSEKYREETLQCPFRLVATGEAGHLSELNIATLVETLDEFDAEQKVVLLQQRKQRMYKTWLDLLSAKTELERMRERRIYYSGVEPLSAFALQFDLSSTLTDQALEEADVKIVTPESGDFLGQIVSVADDTLVVRISDRNKVASDELPEHGHLVVDTSKADAALDKQKSALDAVRYGRAVNASLGDYIVEPETVPARAPVDVDFIQPEIDDDKKDAIRIALAEPALMVIQGPPGTGKTTLISEIVLQTLRHQPNARILLTSQTHVALDNSLERISNLSEDSVRAVRIGHDDDDRISESAKRLLIDRKMPGMRKSAIASGKQFIESWANARQLRLEDIRLAMALERRAGFLERHEVVMHRLGELQSALSEGKRRALEPDELVEIEQEVSSLLAEERALTKDVQETLPAIRQLESDANTVAHLSKCAANELREWADAYANPSDHATAQLRKLLAAHADWESRFGRAPEFRAAVISASQVVAGTCLGVMAIPGRNEIVYDLCIVDEASIATPTEVLVPMARARRTILVGDNKQLSPFQDPELGAKGLLEKYKLTTEDQKATLFDHLSSGLTEGLCKVLATQHRMVPAIGDMISACFYDDGLKSGRKDVPTYLAAAMRRPVTWFTTSKFSNRASHTVGSSHYNELEIQIIVKLLARFDFSISKGVDKKRSISVAVLTGYGEQKRRLRAAIERRRGEWTSFSEIYVNVVDAFQGREADVVVFSVTRSEANGLGFLKDLERINVALSRGKDYVAIVGDDAFCRGADARRNPLKAVLEHMSTHPQDCVVEEATK